MTKNYIGSILKELPDELKAVEGDVWGCATCEVVDKDGDIIRVGGVSMEYHKPESPIKILAQHMTRLPDGKPSVIGKVEEFKRVALKGAGNAPALLFRMSWAKDGKGNLTPLAKEYKDLYDGGYMTDFSVGCEVREHKELPEGGYDFTKTALYEISCVTIGAHQNANKIAELESAKDLNDSVKSLLTGLDEKLSSELRKLHERLDTIEALATVNRPDEAEQDVDRFSAPEPDLSSLAQALTHLRSRL